MIFGELRKLSSSAIVLQYLDVDKKIDIHTDTR